MDPDKKVSIAEAAALIVYGLITDALIIVAWFAAGIIIIGWVLDAGVIVFKFAGDVILFIYFWLKTGQFGKNAAVQGVLAFVESAGIPTTTLSVVAGILIANNPKIAALLSFKKGRVPHVKNTEKAL